MVKFSEMPYTRPDMEAMKAELEAAAGRMRNAGSYEEARAVFFDVQEKRQKTGTMFSIASVRNTINTADAYYEGEIRWLREQSARMMPVNIAWEKALVESPYRKDFEAEFGKQLFKLLEASLMTQDERIIQETIRSGELTQAYARSTAAAVTDFRGEKNNFYGLL